LRPNAELVRHGKVHAAAVYERGASLVVGSADDDLVRWIKDQRSSARQGVRPDVANFARDVRHERTGYFVEVALKRSVAGQAEVVVRIPRVAVVSFNACPRIELIRITEKETSGLNHVVRRRRIFCALGDEGRALNADL